MSEDFSLNDGKLIKYTGNSETVSIPSGTAAIGSMAFNRNPYI